MDYEIPFEEFRAKFVAEIARLGHPPIEDPEIIELIHLEGKTPEEAAAEYTMGL